MTSSITSMPTTNENSTMFLKMKRRKNLTVCNYDEKIETTSELHATLEDQSDTCESESNYSIEINGDIIAQDIHSKHAAAQKRAYWKKKKTKKIIRNTYKAGLLPHDDSNLQSFSDGIQFRHR